MSHKMRFWRIHGDNITEINSRELDNEKRLEDWIEKDPFILGEDLLIIGRQVTTEFGGKIDLLALDTEANTVIIELKKGRTPREIVAQILDYASWVRNLSYKEIDSIIKKYCEKDLSDYFSEHFQQNPPEAINLMHRMIIVASSLDDSSERIVEYLSEEYDISINVIFFNFFKDGESEYLGRAWLMDPEQMQERIESNKQTPWSGYWFVNIGEGPNRNWEDNRKFNYISAGQGEKYSRPLQKLKLGDKIFAYFKGEGYVGFGEVIQEFTPIREFKYKEKPLLEYDLKAEKPQENSEDMSLSEYCVGVKWYKTCDKNNAHYFKGIFANQNIVCKLRDQTTIKFLEERFDVKK